MLGFKVFQELPISSRAKHHSPQGCSMKADPAQITRDEEKDGEWARLPPQEKSWALGDPRQV